MLKLDEKTRDEMVQALKVQIAPAIVGAVLMQIAQILGSLEKVETPDKNIAEQAPKPAPVTPKKDGK